MKPQLNGVGLAIAGTGVLLIWSAWRNWTIADTVRATAALARGDSIPGPGESYSPGYAFAIGGKLNAGTSSAWGTSASKAAQAAAGAVANIGNGVVRQAHSTEKDAAPGSRIPGRLPI